VSVEIKRFDGSDGEISCYIKTEPLTDHATSSNAVEFDDYLPKHEQVVFSHG
jgi:solute carrier family 8 (sodium/calcium exchanger)